MYKGQTYYFCATICKTKFDQDPAKYIREVIGRRHAGVKMTRGAGRLQYYRAMAHRFTVGVEEEFQIVDPQTWELRSHVSELLASSAPALGDQIKREMHQSIVEVGTKICRNVAELRDEIIRIRRELAERRRARRAAHRRRRHPSVLELEGPGHLARRALREHRRRAAAAGALAADLRPARPRRRARSADHDRADERGALLPAAPAGALDQLAVLDGARHRAEVVPHDHLPPLSAHRHSRPLQLVERVRELRQAARRAALHRRRQEDLVGSAAASDLRHAGVPRLRRADAPRSGGRCLPRWPRRSSSSCYRLSPRNLGFRLYRTRADRGEQVARGALGHRRQADRLRQARRKCRCASWRSSCSSSSTTWWTSWGAGGGRVRAHDPARRAPAPTVSCGVPGDRRPARRSSARSSTKRARASNSGAHGAANEMRGA